MSLERSRWVKLVVCFAWGERKGPNGRYRTWELSLPLSSYQMLSGKAQKKPQMPFGGYGGMGECRSRDLEGLSPEFWGRILVDG